MVDAAQVCELIRENSPDRQTLIFGRADDDRRLNFQVDSVREAQDLALAIGENSNVREFQFHFDRRDWDDMAFFTFLRTFLRFVLPTHPSLVRLNFSFVPLDNVCASWIADWLRGNRGIQSLVLSYAFIKDEGIRAIVEGIIGDNGSKASLENLDLTSSVFGDAGAQALGSMLKTDKVALREFAVGSRGDITTVGANALVAGVKVHQSMEKVDLGVLYDNPDAVHSFVNDVLAIHPKLQEVTLEGNNLSCTHAKLLAEWLSSSKCARLDLSFNEIGDEGAIALAMVLRTNDRLLHLNLWLNRYGAAAVEAMESTLTHYNVTATVNMDGAYHFSDLCRTNRRAKEAFDRVAGKMRRVPPALRPAALEGFSHRPTLLFRALRLNVDELISNVGTGKRKRKRPQRLRY